MRVPTPLEAQAADIAAHILGASSWTHLDDGVIEGRRDFDLVFPDGHGEALEVTTSSLAQESIQIDRTLEHDRFDWNMPSGRSNWMVQVQPFGVNVKDLHAGLADLLGEFEDAGVDRVGFAVQPTDEMRRFRERLNALGAVSALRVDRPYGPMIEVQLHLSGSFSAEDVTEAVQAELDNAGNRRKLWADGLSGRHLFVWVDWVGGAHQAAFRSIIDPVSSPVLPDEITSVIAAPDPTEFDGESLGSQVWHSTGDGWVRHGPHPRDHAFLPDADE